MSEEVFYRVQDVLDGKRKKTPKLSKPINPDLFLRKFLICPVCGHALTGSESKGNGGKYAYYHCCHDGKHVRKRAEEMNEGFARYVSCLTPNDTVLKLYEAVLHDIRDEQMLRVRERQRNCKVNWPLYRNVYREPKKLAGEKLKEDAINSLPALNL